MVAEVFDTSRRRQPVQHSGTDGVARAEVEVVIGRHAEIPILGVAHGIDVLPAREDGHRLPLIAQAEHRTPARNRAAKAAIADRADVVDLATVRLGRLPLLHVGQVAVGVEPARTRVHCPVDLDVDPGRVDATDVAIELERVHVSDRWDPAEERAVGVCRIEIGVVGGIETALDRRLCLPAADAVAEIDAIPVDGELQVGERRMLERRIEHDAGRQGVRFLGLQVRVSAAHAIDAAQDEVVRRQQCRRQSLRETERLDLLLVRPRALRTRDAAGVRDRDHELPGDLRVVQFLHARRTDRVLERTAPHHRGTLLEVQFGLVRIRAAGLLVLRVAVAGAQFQ